MAVVLLEQNLGLYVITGLTLLGLLCRLAVNRRCRRLMRQSENLNATKDKQLKNWKKQFEELSDIGNGIRHTGSYLEKCFRRCRTLGLTLRAWRRLAVLATVLSLLGGLGMGAAAWLLHLDYRYVILYGASGVVLGCAGILFRILFDNAGKEAQTLECLAERFEEQLLPRIQRSRALRGGERSPKPVQPPVTLGPEEEKILEDVFREYLT